MLREVKPLDNVEQKRWRRDFSTGPFALRRLVDAPPHRKLGNQPSHAESIPAAIAALAKQLDVVAQAATAGLKFSYTPAITINADQYGAVKTGELPVDLIWDLTLFGLDVKTDDRVDMVITYDGVVGDDTTPGVIIVDELLNQVAYVTYTLSFAGVEQGSWQTKLEMVRDPLTNTPAPVPPADPDVEDVPVSGPTPAFRLNLSAITNPRFSPDDAEPSWQYIGSVWINGATTYRVHLACLYIPARNTQFTEDTTVNIRLKWRKAKSTTWETLDPVLTLKPAKTFNFDDPSGVRHLRRVAQYGSVSFDEEIEVTQMGMVELVVLGKTSDIRVDVAFDGPLGVDPV